MHQSFSITRVKMENSFGIGCCAEPDSCAFEFGAQLRVVVDFSVEHDDQTTVITHHRLGRAVGKIDDRKSPMTESAPSIRIPPRTAAVRAARTHRLPRREE